MERASKTPLLTATQERELAKRIEKGDHTARQHMVEANIRLAVSQARRYQHSGVPFEDLVQEAIIGVDRAATKFDWRTGNKFSTYAMWWIRHMIQRAVYAHRATIRIPGHIADRKRKLERFLNENPDLTLADAAAAQEITLEQAEEALDTVRVVASLDQPLTDEDGGDRYSLVADEGAGDPADMLLPDTHPELRRAMQGLDDLQRRVVELRFGFGDQRVHSRGEVAEILGVKPYIVQRAQRAAIGQLERDLAAAGAGPSELVLPSDPEEGAAPSPDDDGSSFPLAST